jgi:glycosyltransferase involved in cell wall biosynthesis
MPNYNGEEYLAAAVESVLEQDYRPLELLIVDDGSADGSKAILNALERTHPEQVRCFFQPNQGPYPARNLGLAHARGEYIAFLDADDYWDHRFLSKLVSPLESGDADMAYCGWQNLGVAGGFGEPYVPPRYETKDSVALFLGSCPWPIHAAVLRRSLVQELGGFSERLFTSMDYDLWLRARALTERMIRVPEVLAFYRWHDKGQISKVTVRQIQDAWQVRRDFVAARPDLVSHLSADALGDKVDGFLIRNAQQAYWKRDLVTARTLFRLAFKSGALRSRHLRHLLPSLLPQALYSALVRIADRRQGGA